MTLNDIKSRLENLVTLKKEQREVTELFVKLFPLTKSMGDTIAIKLKDPNYVLFDNMETMQSVFLKIYKDEGLKSIVRELLDDTNFNTFNSVTDIARIEPKMNELSLIKDSLCANSGLFNDLITDIRAIEGYMIDYYDYYSRVHYQRYHEYGNKLEKWIGALETQTQYSLYFKDETDCMIEKDIILTLQNKDLTKRFIEYTIKLFAENWQYRSSLYKWIIEARNEGLI